MASKHSSMQMFICMPINKCAPRLKLQYTVQIQQSEWHSPCTSHQCLAPLQTEHCASCNCSLTSKTLAKMGSNPRDRRGGGQLRKRDVSIIVKLKLRNLKKYKRLQFAMVLFHAPSFLQWICNFCSLNVFFINILQVTQILFFSSFHPSLCFSSFSLPPELSLSPSAWHFPLVKTVKSVCEYSNSAIRKEGFVLLYSG